MEKDSDSEHLERLLRSACWSEEDCRWLLEYLEREDQSALHLAAFKSYLTDLYDPYSVLDKQLSATILDRIHKQIGRRQVSRPRARRFRGSFWRNAAVWTGGAVLALGLLYLGYSRLQQPAGTRYTVVQTGRGEYRSVWLPDSSHVWLNAESRLRYSVGLTGKGREVFLQGEAFFDIRKDDEHPFSVRTGGLITRVLGTSFDIKNYDSENDLVVTVVSGKIAVARDAGSAVAVREDHRMLVEADQKAVYDKSGNHLVKATVDDASDYAAWRENQLVFDNTPMDLAVKAIERMYNVRISIDSPELYRCSLYGRYKDLSVKELLNVICTIANAKFEQRSGVIHIRRVATAGK
ncbi:FecR family protein [Compostibacter hankyongensis]|uniref:DUF4974 domain-containing protein n=1 Tax=Compostibacter hankyongensis TaxID=1007089 RepID=A0ABP8FC77_9BACT